MKWDFWYQLDGFHQTLWIIALVSSLIFIIQTILTFIGGDVTDGVDADFEGSLVDADAPFQLFSFRNLIHFLLGFSWTCLSFSNLIQQKTILLTTGVAVGALFVWVFFLIMQQLQKLAEDNSFVFEQTVGLSANVYLTIPAAMQGKGKVLLSVKGSVHELAAMTHNEALPTGTVVIVKHIEAGNILIVDKLA